MIKDAVANAGPLDHKCSRPILRFTGELDLATAPTVRAAVDRACQHASGDVMVDLADVQFLDVITMGIFDCANDWLNETGRRLTLHGLSASQEKVLRICTLDRLLAVAGYAQDNPLPARCCMGGPGSNRVGP